MTKAKARTPMLATATACGPSQPRRAAPTGQPTIKQQPPQNQTSATDTPERAAANGDTPTNGPPPTSEPIKTTGVMTAPGRTTTRIHVQTARRDMNVMRA